MKTKILVVDDEEAYLDIIGRFLDLKDCNVLKCGRSTLALDLIKNNHFDVLITDIGMPVLNGIELIKEVRNVQPQIKIICLSGYSDILDEDPEVTKGAKMLSKPFKVADLFNILPLPDKKVVQF